MKLKRMNLHGFKSFREKTTINFDTGITGIVGPNGCGKSNIVDALFWVMGEMSAKHLRGSSMKDVIFAGSDKYAPAAWAEVSLVLENEEEKHIHIGGKVVRPHEIELTRKLYRNSESEYRINGQICRLKDIQEVFMDTGAGAKSYSIIAQGEIDRLVRAKPEERRVMIEEVAGITKFKLRKKESLRKIDQTHQNLGRLHDLQKEIDKNLSSLKKQAEKAERAKVLKEKMKKFDLVNTSHKVFENLKTLKDLRSKNVEAKLILENNSLEQNRLELSLESERAQKDILTTKLDQVQKLFHDDSAVLAASEERVHSYDREVEQKKLSLNDIEQEKKSLEEGLETLKQKIENQKNELESFKDKDFSSNSLEELEQEVKSFHSQVQELEQKLASKEEELLETKERKQNIDQALQFGQKDVVELSQQLEDITEDINLLEKEHSLYSDKDQESRKKIAELGESIQSFQDRKTVIDEEVTGLQGQKNELAESLNSLTKRQVSLESKKEGLHSIISDLTSERQDAENLVETHQNLEIFSEIIEINPDYLIAAEKLLAPYLNSIIATGKDWKPTQEEDLSFEFIHAEKDSTRSDEEVKERLEMKGLTGITALNQVVTLKDPSYGQVFEGVLEGAYIVDNLSAVDLMNLDVNFKSLVSKDGLTFVSKNSQTLKVRFFRSEDVSKGLLEYQTTLEKVCLDEEQVSQELALVVEKHQETLTKLSTQEEEQLKLYHQLLEAKSELAEKESSFEVKERSIHSAQEKLERLQKRKFEISHKKRELLEKTEGQKKELSGLAEKFEEFKQDVNLLTAEHLEEKKRYELKQSDFFKIKVEQENFEQNLLIREEAFQDSQDQLSNIQNREEFLEERNEKLQEEIEKIDKDKLKLVEKNNEMAQSLATVEEDLRGQKVALDELLQSMKEREDRIKVLVREINQAEKDLVSFDLKIDQGLEDEEFLVRDILEKYQINLRASLGEFLDYEDSDFEALKAVEGLEQGGAYEFIRRYGQDLRDCKDKYRNAKSELNRIGEINWQAVEEYDRQKVRYDFLKEQEDELRASLEDLQQAIDHIDQKSKIRFKDAYDTVSEKFQKVFPLIFGGGSARLQLVGQLDSDDFGIDIIAQPPGKKMQNINLMSGGEKALTAVSMIFSIFLVKPSPFCLLDEVDAPLDDANVIRFNELLREMSRESQFILITHNKKTMELNDMLYGVTMQEPGISKAVSVQLQ